jgi:hypothetical protein
MLMHYFSCTGRLGVVSIESGSGHIMPRLYFCIKWNLRVAQCIPVRPGCEMSTHLFS